MTVWEAILAEIQEAIPDEDFLRWFRSTAYVSDSGDLITVWVPAEAIRRHIMQHYQHELNDALVAVGRAEAELRFVVGGIDEDDEDV